ncbi:hypothetical protein PUS82_05335 [Cytobacillus firmus]|uniref:hypothetical protein n=1 Tax=Cytobacillus firmus TaxID=1399 RepID=UPI00237A7097|nr:hypothetical protein [Cytobacillus firmus]MDD9310726.1 hypothetical protein [Cytobacillus firmus]
MSFFRKDESTLMREGFVTISDSFSQRHISVEMVLFPAENRIEIDCVELIRLYPSQKGLDVDMGELKTLLMTHIKECLNT